MEALLNKQFQGNLDEEDEELERKIQAELDNYEYNEGASVMNKTFQSNNDRSLLEKEENIEDLDAWKDLQEFKKVDEKMFEKFERNIKNLKEITGKFKEKDENPEKSEEILEKPRLLLAETALFTHIIEKKPEITENGTTFIENNIKIEEKPYS